MPLPKKVLLLEDELFHKELIFRAFEDCDDMALVWTETLAEARQLLATEKPDLVISDWRLSDGSGIDLVLSSRLGIPFILMTSFGNEELAVQSMKAGVMDYLVKSPQAFENLPQNARRALREWDNITARQQAEVALRESEERYRLAAEGANDVIWAFEPQNKNVSLSGHWVDLLGIRSGQTYCTFRELLRLIHPTDRRAIIRETKRHLQGETEVFACECRFGQGEAYKWVFARGKALSNDRGELIRFAGSFTDISDRKRNLQRIEELAFFDSITGLPNRVYFTQKLEQVLGQANPASGMVLFIDLDNFKIINDTFGHSWGDRCLVEAGKMIDRLDIAHKFLCRLGGDEFIMIVENLSSPASGVAVAQQIVDCFRVPVVIEDTKFYLSVSMGIAVYPGDGTTVDEILKNADAALYRSKAKGRNTYTFFDKSINQLIVEKMTMGNLLRTAIANNEFRLHYQPQIEIATGKICGLEALLRWESPDLGFVPPLQFIRLAEEMGLIVPIGYWVIRQACSFAAHLSKVYPDLCMSINLSSVQLMQIDFVDRVQEIIQETGVPPRLIGFEITESMLMESFESSVEKLMVLKELGLSIELDDFGTGYSSLNYLKRLPISTVKIDKTFIDDIVCESIQNDITDLIVNLAHKLSLRVIAEGVETKEQMGLLRAYHCDIIQGYFISKPISETAVEVFLAEQNEMSHTA